jgi:hypothetical protein
MRPGVGRAVLASAVLATATAGALGARAATEERHASCGDAGSGAVGCHFRHTIPGDTRPAGPASATGDGARRDSPASPQGATLPAPPGVYYAYRVETGPDGRPCWRGSAADAPNGDGGGAQQRADRDYLAQSHGAALPPCPGQDVAGAPTASDIGAQPAGPAAAAPGSARPPTTTDADVSHALGSPQPRIEPGRAIAGKTAYLEIDGTARRSFTIADRTGGPDVHVDATPRYRVDWGDGTVVETSSGGGPWPNGDVTHTYQRAGHYDVVVTAEWTGRWATAGGDGGDLDGITTAGRITGFPVTEVQPVRER